jgi:predicted RNase H-like nuclease (RuvC/YqgF family)
MTAEESTTAKAAMAEKNSKEEAKINEGASDEVPAVEAELPAAGGASAAEVPTSDDGSDGDEDLTDDAKAKKRKERLEQNRISARESRKRKKTMIEELQRTVITLSRENKDLNDRNDQLRTQLMEIGTNVSIDLSDADCEKLNQSFQLTLSHSISNDSIQMWFLSRPL